MVWGAIAYNTRSPLVLIRCTMTVQWYAHDILQPHVLPLMQWLPEAIFHYDNARPQSTRYLDSERLSTAEDEILKESHQLSFDDIRCQEITANIEIKRQFTNKLVFEFGQEKLSVWCALWAGGIIGPYFFKNDEGHNVTVNGDRYRAMITNLFIPELNNHDVQKLWFQQDGATCHTARATIDLLKDTFGDRLISRFGPVNWPPRSCDLTPLDYFW
ncbi:DUF4817 domain-containing protein [Trichonephila clavipes]|nr:DUF4817 domain-containing protein [Trichonephila clavipes]